MTDAAFLFSGGVDSTAGAERMLESFDRVHLMTWKVGSGFVFTDWSRTSGDALIQRFPGRVVHHMGDPSQPFERIVRRRIVELAWSTPATGRPPIPSTKWSRCPSPPPGSRPSAVKLELLRSTGLPRGRTLFGQNPGTQPLRLTGNLIYLRSTIFNSHPSFEPDQVSRFLHDHEEWFDSLVG